MSSLENNSDARQAILKSIRDHLTASRPHDAIHGEIKAATDRLHHQHTNPTISLNGDRNGSLIEQFKESLDSVDGHCIVAAGEIEVIAALKKIISSLQGTPLRPRRVAVSDSPMVQRLVRRIESDVEEIAVTPDSSALFSYDLGISSAQLAIAETGTLVLQSNHERHRLVSLLPPVHIAIVGADKLCATLGEALSLSRPDGSDLSPAITFITGPSRTADIELTLAIGVHGPQKLFVIIDSGAKDLSPN
jgi:L-lactate dehydrogenase complex protein LldG